ncbi:hypothetical protein M885DRAFT_491414 [Pelagophyceae sp. CCMP2097]|nr:hypothetical protein M885DRAFT_491414 [Pelagophyceae sp. CCMP2097]|mmetsp:Transcript_31426/g.105821  ORF Transcript_31426/g.105821 Transcript_31426/m.105821 type:complete len:286 (-) Transcript_31426:94-951(-)
MGRAQLVSLGCVGAAAVLALAKYLAQRRRGPKVCASLEGKVVLVTGAESGLGLEFSRLCLARGATVYATCRWPAQADGLKALAATVAGSRLAVIELDITNPAPGCAAVVADLKRSGRPLDILINNAGIATKNHPFDPIISQDVDENIRLFSNNVGGTIKTTNAFLGAMEGGCKMVVSLSSDLGSITNAVCAQSVKVQAGGVSCYRISKAAINMATRIYYAELAPRGFTVLAMSPGWVVTQMGSKGGRTPPLNPNQACTGMLDVLQGVTFADSGKYFKYDGTQLPW